MAYHDGDWRVIVVASGLIFMLLLLVSSRFVSRSLKKAKLGVDDCMLVAGFILSLVLCGLSIAYPRITEVAAQLGHRHEVDLSIAERDTRMFIAFSVIYGLSIATAKWSILLLYLRVFTTLNIVFNGLVYLMGTIVTATAVANTFVAIFPCSPGAYAWNNESMDGKCVDIVAFNRYMAIPNVVTGTIMLLMPIPLILKLNVTLLQKVALAATFFHGIVGVVASCARLIFLKNTDASAFNQAAVQTIWTINEPANYIIAACLPTLRPLFALFVPESFFVLSRSRPTTSDQTFVFSWAKGSWKPKIRFIDSEQFEGIICPSQWSSSQGNFALGTHPWSDLESPRSASFADKKLPTSHIMSPGLSSPDFSAAEHDDVRYPRSSR